VVGCWLVGGGGSGSGSGGSQQLACSVDLVVWSLFLTARQSRGSAVRRASRKSVSQFERSARGIWRQLPCLPRVLGGWVLGGWVLGGHSQSFTHHSSHCSQ